MAASSGTASENAERIFREHGGTLRTGEALKAGIHPRTLYALRDAGRVERLARGLYRLATAEPAVNPDLLTVAARIPKGVVCLVSALAFHQITTQIPHAVDLALPKGAWTPRLEHPPVRTYRFGGKAMSEGIETHDVSHVSVRIFSAEKTLADCFKFRHKIGLDIAIEALRMYWRRGRADLSAITRFAEIDRVTAVMRPYLEAML
ncbi:MAG: transcriptional regulator [Planctomycetes bacterium]|nr:transcriptional regulator [Planctomycetota bacterium]